MKKLMVVAAVAALSASTFGGIKLTNCTHKISAACPQIVFKVTGSGKTVQEVEKGDAVYKTVSKLKISKGALVLFADATQSDYSDPNDPLCCYATWSLYLNVKVGKESYKYAWVQQDLEKWSVFGKNLDAAAESEKSKKYSLESDLGISLDEETSEALDGLDDLEDVSFIATSFGKMTYKFTAAKTKTSGCQVCTIGTDSAKLTPGKYSGWFAGWYTKLSDADACATCTCADIDLFGGTWKASYESKWSGKAGSSTINADSDTSYRNAGWYKAASYVFGSSVAKLMAEEEVE